MDFRALGRTGIDVPLLSYGTGGAGKFGTAAGLDAAARKRLVERCLDLGINFFDTAAGYGDSEKYLGESLAGVPRDSYTLCTKWSGGEWLQKGGLSLTESVHRSLRRMRTDCIDVFLFHMIDARLYGDHVDRLYPEIARLPDHGKVRHIGFTQTIRREPRCEAVVLALRTHPELWDVVMLKYGIMNQWAAKEALPLAAQHNVGIINMAVVRTTLTDRSVMAERLQQWRDDGTLDPGDLTGDDPFDWLVHGDVGSVAEAAYRFAAEHGSISTVLTGTGSLEHLEANAAAIERGHLHAPDSARLRELLKDSCSPD